MRNCGGEDLTDRNRPPGISGKALQLILVYAIIWEVKKIQTKGQYGCPKIKAPNSVRCKDQGICTARLSLGNSAANRL